jgi:hypothetical protein
VMPLDEARTWLLRSTEPPELVGPGAKIVLEPDVPTPSLSPDGTKMAYALRDRVVVRSLPSGAVLFELARSR